MLISETHTYDRVCDPGSLLGMVEHSLPMSVTRLYCCGSRDPARSRERHRHTPRKKRKKKERKTHERRHAQLSQGQVHPSVSHFREKLQKVEATRVETGEKQSEKSDDHGSASLSMPSASSCPRPSSFFSLFLPLVVSRRKKDIVQNMHFVN